MGKGHKIMNQVAQELERKAKPKAASEGSPAEEKQETPEQEALEQETPPRAGKKPKGARKG